MGLLGKLSSTRFRNTSQGRVRIDCLVCSPLPTVTLELARGPWLRLMTNGKLEPTWRGWWTGKRPDGLGPTWLLTWAQTHAFPCQVLPFLPAPGEVSRPLIVVPGQSLLFDPGFWTVVLPLTLCPEEFWRTPNLLRLPQALVAPFRPPTATLMPARKPGSKSTSLATSLTL